MRVRTFSPSSVLLAAALLLGGSVLGGCVSEPRVRVAGGAIEAGAWTAWAFHGSGDLRTCVEIEAAGRGSSRICNLESSDPSSWQPDTPAGESGFVAGTTLDPRAVTAVLALADGSQVTAAVVDAPSVGAIRIFVIVAPPVVERDHVDLIDGAGTVVATLPLH